MSDNCIGPDRGCSPGYQGGYHSERCKNQASYYVSHDHAVGREAMAMACKAVDAARATRPDPTAKKASFLLGWDAALAAVEKELLK